MLNRGIWLVGAFLAAQAILVGFVSGRERLPDIPDLSRFPVDVDQWHSVREDPLSDEAARMLGADARLARTYLQSDTGLFGDLLVAWFQSQRGGARQPHSPKVCLPGSGWTPVESADLTIATSAGPITVNRYVVADRTQRAIVLYWYQTPRRVLAGEWSAKFWLAADAFGDHRSDTALVRLLVWTGKSSDAAATQSAVAFTQRIYPKLLTLLPN